jgi:hypothetical protein
MFSFARVPLQNILRSSSQLIDKALSPRTCFIHIVRDSRVRFPAAIQWVSCLSYLYYHWWVCRRCRLTLVPTMLRLRSKVYVIFQIEVIFRFVDMFKTIPVPGLLEYNTVLGAFAIESTAQACDQIFEHMINSGLKPDQSTFVLLLRAQRNDRSSLFRICTLMYQHNVKATVEIEWILVKVYVLTMT